MSKLKPLCKLTLDTLDRSDTFIFIRLKTIYYEPAGNIISSSFSRNFKKDVQSVLFYNNQIVTKDTFRACKENVSFVSNLNGILSYVISFFVYQKYSN